MQRAITQADRRPAGVSILVGRNRQLLERLLPMTARHLVQQTVLTNGECTPDSLRSALLDARPGLRPGTILFVTLLEVDFDWEAELRANLAGYSPGVRVFGLSTGRQARLDQVSAKASILWLDWPGTDTVHFVDTMLNLWQEGAYPFSYERLADDLASLLRGSPRPRLLVRGAAAPAFGNQRPFTVSPPPPIAQVHLVETLTGAIRTKHPVTLGYRNEQGNELRLSFTPLLLGTSDGKWRVLGRGANQDYCLHLDRMVALEKLPESSTQAAPAAPTRDHFQHCIEVVDVWSPPVHHDG